MIEPCVLRSSAVHTWYSIGRERQVQRQGAQRAEARAELSVELAQARILPAYEVRTNELGR